MKDFVEKSGDQTDQPLPSPGEPPHPDDQGTFKTCTGHSLAKATVGGYDEEFFPPCKLNLSQNEAKDELLKFYPNKNDGKWPDEFDKKSITLTENTNNDSYNITLHVCEVSKLNMLKEIEIKKKDGTLKNNQKRTCKHVMVYPNPTVTNLHSVYLDHVYEHELRNGTVLEMTFCLNSHGTVDPFVCKDVNGKGNTYFQVKCSAQLQGKPGQAPVCNQSGSGKQNAKNSQNVLVARKINISKPRPVSFSGHRVTTKQTSTSTFSMAKPYGSLSRIHTLGGPGGGESTSTHFDDNEINALAQAIAANTKIPRTDTGAALKRLIENNHLKTEDPLKRFHDTLFHIDSEDRHCKIQIEVIQMSIEEILQEDFENSNSRYILHYPIDFTEPAKMKRFAHIPEIFAYNGYKIAYCEKVFEDDDEECINLGRKGNSFFKIVTTVTYDNVESSTNLTEHPCMMNDYSINLHITVTSSATSLPTSAKSTRDIEKKKKRKAFNALLSWSFQSFVRIFD